MDRDPQEFNPSGELQPPALTPADADEPTGSEPNAEEESGAMTGLAPAAQPATQPASKTPALVINIQSWATPIVGVVMLLVGLAGGFFLRPSAPIAAVPTQTPAPAEPPQSQASETDREALMAALLPQVRHFLGDPNAPVTIIEFSDFQ